jgi:hypothetical protein
LGGGGADEEDGTRLRIAYKLTWFLQRALGGMHVRPKHLIPDLGCAAGMAGTGDGNSVARVHGGVAEVGYSDSAMFFNAASTCGKSALTSVQYCACVREVVSFVGWIELLAKLSVF